jgi:hypothetical protein
MARTMFLLVMASFLFATFGLSNFRGFLRLARPSRIRAKFEEDDPELGAFSSPVQDLIDGLQSLGFRALGVKVEEPPMGGAIRSLAFEAVEVKAFASIVGLQRPNPSYYFYTPFQSGAVVLTSSQVMLQPVQTDSFVHQGFKTPSMDDLLAMHLRTVESMVNAAHQPFEQYTREARIQAPQLYYAHPHAAILQQRLRAKLLGNFAWTLLLLGIAVGFFLYRLLSNGGLIAW